MINKAEIIELCTGVRFSDLVIENLERTMATLEAMKEENIPLDEIKYIAIDLNGEVYGYEYDDKPRQIDDQWVGNNGPYYIGYFPFICPFWEESLTEVP